MSDQNDHLVLVSGKSSTGKSASLMGLTEPESVLYLNCENNKKLPFRAKFAKDKEGNIGFTITDPMQVYQAFEYADKTDGIKTIVIDSLTYLMDMYETCNVLTSSNTMKAWGEYAQYFKRLMSQYVAKSNKNVIFTAHTSDIINETEMAQETLVKVKGSIMNTGIESYFSTVISTKKVPLKLLENYENDLLLISDEEKNLEYKYVFQTKLTKETVNERMRSPLGMWDAKETYIDNNLQSVIDRLHEYYD